MDCRNHPGVAAVGRCAGCAEAFCGNCLVNVMGQTYCGSCKTMAVPANAAFIPESATIPCKEAKDALVTAIVGLFCFGIILGPMAIYKANKAKKMIALNPRLTGSGQATAAIILGILDILGFVAVMYTRVNRM